MLLVFGPFKLLRRTDGTMRLEGDFPGGPPQVIDVPATAGLELLAFMQAASAGLGEAIHLDALGAESELEARAAAQQPDKNGGNGGSSPNDDPAAT